MTENANINLNSCLDWVETLLTHALRACPRADRAIIRARGDGPIIRIRNDGFVGTEDYLRLRRNDTNPSSNEYDPRFLEQVMETGHEVSASIAPVMRSFRLHMNPRKPKMPSLICVPISNAKLGPIGACQVDTYRRRSRFTTRDVAKLVDLSQRASILAGMEELMPMMDLVENMLDELSLPPPENES